MTLLGSGPQFAKGQRRAGIPLYVDVRENLARRLQAGEWGPTTPLPSEQDLCSDFGVSRTTVRQAMADLVKEGLVVRKAGKGTFVREPTMILGVKRYHSFRDDLRDRGVEPSSQLISAERLAADHRLLRDVRFEGGAAVHIRTLRLGDGKPVLLYDHLFPRDIGELLLEDDLSDPNLSFRELTVEKHGVPFARATGSIEAALIGPTEAALLKVQPNTPIVKVWTQTFDHDDRLVEVSTALLRTDRYALVLNSEWA